MRSSTGHHTDRIGLRELGPIHLSRIPIRLKGHLKPSRLRFCCFLGRLLAALGTVDRGSVAVRIQLFLLLVFLRISLLIVFLCRLRRGLTSS